MQKLVMEQTKKTYITEELIAYLAGLIDGEGHLDILLRQTPSVRKVGRGYAREFRLIIAIGSKELLEGIQRDLGNRGRIFLHKTAGYQAGYNNKTRINVYSLRFGANELRLLLPRLIPHLRLKRKAAQYMLKILTYISETKLSRTKEIELLKMDLEFRRLRVETPGSKCKFTRRDSELHNKILAEHNKSKLLLT